MKRRTGQYAAKRLLLGVDGNCFALLSIALGLLLSVGARGAELDRRYALIVPYVGLHVGTFAAALTPDPSDDLNFNPCDDRVRDCSRHKDPLIDILLELSPKPDGSPAATFFRSEVERETGATLDLLGPSCGTRIGALRSFSTTPRSAQADNPVRWTAGFELKVANRSCVGKLRPTSTHRLLVHGLMNPETGERTLQVAIDRSVVERNYLYVKENGIERRVKIDLDNTEGTGRRARYRVCIEDDEGEYSRCVVTDRTLKNFALPLPVPGGVAVNYTWWYDLYPNLKRTRGLYELEQYLADFQPMFDPLDPR